MANKKLTDPSVPVATTTEGLVLYGGQDGATKKIPAALLVGQGGSGAGSVASRNQLANLGTAANSATFVAEPGVEGTFKFSASDQLAKVAADTDKALVVAPASAPSGSSGAHIRIVDREYKADWWLNGASNNVAQPLKRMLAQVPAGSTIVLPPRELGIEGGSIYANQAGLTIKGTRGLSVLRSVGPLIGNGEGPLAITNSYCTVEGVTFAPPRHTAQSGGGFGLAVGAYYRNRAYNPSAALAGPLVAPRIIDCEFVDGSEGLIFIADNNGGTLRYVENPIVRGCRFRNLDYQGLSLFGITGGDISGNDFEMAPHRTDGNGVAYGFACVIRLLSGSSGYRIHHNRVKGLGLNATNGSDSRSSFIYFSGMSLDGLFGKGLFGGQVDHNAVRDAVTMWHFSEGPRGKLILESNTLTNPDTNAIADSSPAIWNASTGLAGAPHAFDELILRDNRYRGVNNGFTQVSGNMERFELNSERVKWGGKTPTGGASCVATTTFSGQFLLKEVHVRDCEFDFPDGAAETYFFLDLRDAASRASVIGNEAPPGSPLYGFISAIGSGSVRTELAGDYKTAASVVTPGDNGTKSVTAGGGSGGGGGGANLIPNGDFSSASGWTLPTGTSIAGGKLVFTNAASYPVVRRTDCAIPAGTLVRVTVVVSAYTSGQVKPLISVGGATFATPATTFINSTGTYTFDVTTAGPGAVSGYAELYAEPGFVGEIDSFTAVAL